MCVQHTIGGIYRNLIKIQTLTQSHAALFFEQTLNFLPRFNKRREKKYQPGLNVNASFYHFIDCKQNIR